MVPSVVPFGARRARRQGGGPRWVVLRPGTPAGPGNDLARGGRLREPRVGPSERNALPMPYGPGRALPRRSLGALDDDAYHRVVRGLGEGVVALASPRREDRLFPGTEGRQPNDATTFAHGAAGVLWALAEIGVEVPTEHADWLIAAPHRLYRPGPGLGDGLSGIALALERLGRPAAADPIWRAVDRVPVAALDLTLAAGLPGIGLALLERTPIPDPTALLDRVEVLAGELSARLRAGAPFPGVGLWQGGSGAALFLLHTYELTVDPALLPPIHRALHDDLAALGWRPGSGFANPGRWRHPPFLAPGVAEVAMVLHQATEHLTEPWLSEARDAIVAASRDHLAHHPGLGAARAGMVLALQYLRSRPQDTAEARFALVRPHLEPLTLRATSRQRHPGVPLGLSTGTAGILLVLDHLRRAGDHRLPFFW